LQGAIGGKLQGPFSSGFACECDSFGGLRRCQTSRRTDFPIRHSSQRAMYLEAAIQGDGLEAHPPQNMLKKKYSRVLS
jgi:hypothetical protein